VGFLHVRFTLRISNELQSRRKFREVEVCHARSFFQWTLLTLSTKKKDGNDYPISGCAPASEIENARLMAVFVWLAKRLAQGSWESSRERRFAAHQSQQAKKSL
jgi:hypothetical protein